MRSYFSLNKCTADVPETFSFETCYLPWDEDRSLGVCTAGHGDDDCHVEVYQKAAQLFFTCTQRPRYVGSRLASTISPTHIRKTPTTALYLYTESYILMLMALSWRIPQAVQEVFFGVGENIILIVSLYFNPTRTVYHHTTTTNV